MSTLPLQVKPTAVEVRPELASEGAHSAQSGLRLGALDGMRGVAILLVMGHHFARCMGDTTPAWHFMHAVANAGWVGVDLFFVLSGFLITGILEDSKGGANYFRNFYMRRVLRIFPLYFGTLAALLVLGSLGNWASFDFDRGHFYQLQPWLWTFTSNILIARSHQWVATAAPFELNHFWSLAVEEQFYLLWPLAVLLLTRQRLSYVLFLLVGISLGLRLWLEHSAQEALASLVLTPCHFDALAIGALVALAVRQRPAESMAVLARTVVAVGGVILVAAMIYQGAWDYQGKFVKTGGFLLQALVFGAILVLALCERTWVRKILSGRVLRLAGTYSFGLYVIHHVLVFFFFRYLDPEGVARWSGSNILACAWYFAAAGGISFALAWLSYHFYEKPFLRLKRYFGQ